jgi:tRNA(fMet)-specific endonuclease VapC
VKYLLDTDTCVAALRGHTGVRARLRAVAPDECGVSMVSVFELFSGVERCRRPEEEGRKVGVFLAPLHLLPFDYVAAQRAATVRWHLEKSGQPIGPYDLQIAGQALSLEVILVTSNTREFVRVPGLQVEDWAD